MEVTKKTLLLSLKLSNKDKLVNLNQIFLHPTAINIMEMSVSMLVEFKEDSKCERAM
jgi:hypothetical protein